VTSGAPKVVVVTGASAGIGRATAVAFAQRGASIGLLARGEAGLEGALADVEGAGATAVVVPTDVADAEAVERAAGVVEDELGPIDVWVNNAMTTVFAPAWEVSPAEFRRATEVTYLGQVYGTLSALRRMRPRDRGVVCNVGSALAFRAIPLQSAYCAAKFASRGFTEAVRAELLHEGSNVHMTMVHLPAVNTPQFTWCVNRLKKVPRPVPPTYAPELAAATIVEACLDARRHKILGGFNKFLVVANKVAPGIIDHYVARTGVDSQQTDLDADPDAPFDLWQPVDGAGGKDHGARGIFSDSEGGMLTRQWVASVPRIAVDAALATVDRAREVIRKR
jgi:NAD(P)-dependent dehydrogenase (short-subunit alcohol dehydrogenase family)